MTVPEGAGEGIGFNAAGLASILLGLVAPVLGVGAGDVGGFKSS